MDVAAKTRVRETLAPHGTGTFGRTFVLAAVAGTLYQILKNAAFPHLTLAQSQTATVILIGLAAAATHFLALRRWALVLGQRDVRFGQLFFHNPFPMWLFDSGTLRFLEVNDAAVAHYGYSRDEFLSMTIFDIRPKEDIPRLQEELLAPRSEFREAGTWRHRLKDGGIIWVQIAIHLTEWKGRNANLVVARDVSESRRNEEALRATEGLFRTAFDEAPLGMCLTGLDGRFLRANSTLSRILGYSTQELMGGAFAAITHPDDIARSRQAVTHLIENPAEPVEFEKRYIAKDGRVIWVQLKISTVMNESRKPSHWVTHVEDITERKRAKEELVKARDAAEAASRAKSQFLANMSHEIRTPMNGIMGMTELALASPLSAEQRDYLNTVRTSSESLLDIINDILDFSKIEAEKFALNVSEFDLDQVLQETMRMMSVPAHERGLELLYENRVELPDRLLGDGGRLRQVVVNLLGNAIKFTTSGEISLALVDAREDDGGMTVHVAVSDTGMGVAPEWQARIFEAFVQADGSHTRNHGGTGLGLAICSRLVSAMGGRIWVESALGRGSMFHFTAKFGTPAGRRMRTPPEEAQSLQGLRVLVVDHSEALRRILSDTLVRWQMEPVLAETGQAALRTLNEFARRGERFDLALLDAEMGEFESCPELAGVLAGPRILMLNSLDADARVSELRASRVYVVKPVMPGNLLEALLHATGSSQKRVVPSRVMPAATALRSLRILLAEDNVVNQKVAVRLVEKLGHSVEIAANGELALAACAQKRFDLVLMDVQMPVMNGHDAARAIRACEQGTGRHIPIVALTAHALKEDRGICLESGMDDYLTKPIRSRELASALERWGTAANQAAAPFSPN